MAGYIDIFGNPSDCAVYLDFLYNWKSEKTISCWANQSDGITAFRVLSMLNEDADREFFDTLIEEFCNETPGTTFLSFLWYGIGEDNTINFWKNDH